MESSTERLAWFIIVATGPSRDHWPGLGAHLRCLFAKPVAAVFLTIDGLILLSR